MSINGLEPNSQFTVEYKFYANGREYKSSQTVSTKGLTLTTQQPKVISPGNVIVAAQSNLDDEEEKVGFEWRRTDWTDDFTSNSGTAYLYEGQIVRLVLKGSNKTYDSLHTDYKAEDYSFTILANSFKDRTKQEWDKKYLLSFGLVTGEGNLTNAGALFADDCPLWQSRLYCTRWDGKEKGDAINDAEFTGNVLMLLREAMNFVKSNTKRGWEKLPDGRKNKPEYAERAVLEAMVNHFIHRDYTVMGSEVHLDIYDNRLIVTSPGGMYNGLLIQDLDIKDVSSERRNPILANVMAQLDYMEKRGSGLTRICNETKALDGYKDELKPVFKSTPTQFQTIIFASSDTPNVGDHDGDMSETKLTERQQKILNLIKESPTITGKQMSETLSVSQRTIERDLSTLQKLGVLKRKGKDNDGKWVIISVSH